MSTNSPTHCSGLLKTAQEKGIDQKDLEKVKETWKKAVQSKYAK
jgi:hypothetical protein